MRRKHGIGLLAAVAVAAIATSVGGQFGAQAAEPVAAQGGSDAAAATLGATAVAKHHPQKPAKKPLAGLRILMSNDDSMQAARANGKDGIGLYDMRKSLCAAGADVVVIAPWGYMSGAGGAVTNSGQFTAEQRTALPAGYEDDCASAPSGGAVFGLCRDTGCTPDSLSATPADTVKFALHGGLKALVGWKKAPDLVVTGINSGPNVSASINDSGTVGSAIAGIDNEVPAIAFSGHVEPVSDTVTRPTYVAAADFGARLIAQLRAKRLLTDAYVLNVNYPDVTNGQRPGKPVWTRVGLGTFGVHAYSPTASGSRTFTIGWAVCPAEHCIDEPRRDADSTALFAGKITLTALTRDRTLQTGEDHRLRALVKSGQLMR
ncbi:putative hydrolase [Microlunatus phosphovorus NM-1]|uniref:5'-nucleotidase n=1 Tax=Microlunatus phosphovorus (strain ATCC 700054 / DSM 10555 / JCM 9379 / NBRC 101784 / NCIMB 13414 / VKM Ac-1990 / NM-1) TaxID=1032480 RepID=F5XFU9_MICPN|nr:5'/3'-nucleotidase SurE [Microlunatus phosphovorus]BAK35506.1 putative hydrolase [Microlunatus phosphovorus NM-1]